MDRVHDVLRGLRYGPRTRALYASWIRKFLIAARKPAERLGADDVDTFLGKLAATSVAPATHNQALAAIICLFTHVLPRPLEKHVNIGRAAAPQRIPVVLTPHEVARMLQHLDGCPEEWRGCFTARAYACSSAAACGSKNWGNYESLLQAYAALKRLLARADLSGTV